MQFAKALACLFAIIVLSGATPAPLEERVFEAYPDEIVARIEQFNKLVVQIPLDDVNKATPNLVMADLQKWIPGQTVRVAFNGGDQYLYKKIADVASEWQLYANIQLDFGFDATNGNYRTWSAADTDFVAEIRVSFSNRGYWSLVGTNSVNRAIVTPAIPSMNLERFNLILPANWKAVVLHEFGHALGAEHEHQHPTEGCDAEWRWDDDPSYESATDSQGRYLPDSQNRRPGLYTILSGFPNNWSRSKVDFNIRQLKNTSAYRFGPFDRNSIMKYYFAAWMFRNGEKSQCYTGTENAALSADDKARMKEIYPKEPNALTEVLKSRAARIESIVSSSIVPWPIKVLIDEQLSALLRK